jgi:hypothetical protein
MDREAIAQSCIVQAEWAEKLGSPMYTAPLHRIAEDVRAGGPCFAVMEPHAARTRGLAPLLLLAAMHRMVLEGQLPDAARFYPSAGGIVNVDALWPHFLEGVSRAALPVCVQTNEVGRSRGLLPGFVEVARKAGLPLRLLEIGSSAGLNLRWDHFAFLDVPDFVRVVERRGCDLNPIDPTLEESKPAMLCFVWPDQAERLRHLLDALEIAKRVPAQVDQSDAAPWLEEHLSEPRKGVATVVFHSVVMPYLSEEARAEVRRIIEEAGARASVEAPLAWLSMEPAAEGPDIHLTMWPGGERRLIAQASFHGQNVKVL